MYIVSHTALWYSKAITINQYACLWDGSSQPEVYIVQWKLMSDCFK